MDYASIFNLISDITKKKGASCVLIGGFAVNFYKVTRQTLDVDFLTTKEDFDKILVLLEEKGFKQDYVQDVFTKLKSNKPPSIDIDFMFVDKETIDKIVNEGKEICIAKYKFIIPSLNHLIALKLHSLKNNYKIRQYKDFPDIINLIRINKVDYKSKEFKELCLKYGTQEIYNKILESM